MDEDHLVILLLAGMEKTMKEPFARWKLWIGCSDEGYDGSNTQLPISTPSRITSVTYSPEFDDLILEVANGATINLSQVKRIMEMSLLNPVVQSTGGPAILDLLKDRTEINTNNKSQSEN